MNLGSNADAYAAGKTEGYENSAYVALEECVEVLNEKGTKVAINGGSQNPAGLAKKVNAMVRLPFQYKYASCNSLHACSLS